MVAVTGTVKQVAPNAGCKVLKVELPATATTGDTFTITLANTGIKTIEAVYGFIHSTTDSIVIADTAITTSVANGALTVTCSGAASGAKKRVYMIVADSV